MNYKKQKVRPKQKDHFIHKQLFSREKQQIETLRLPRKLVKRQTDKIQRIQSMIQHLDSKNQFFSSLKLPNLQQFLDYNSKVQCTCKRNIRFFCSKCLFKNPNLNFPNVKLPFNMVILHHPEEKSSKSSGLPLKFLSDDIKVVYFNESLDFNDYNEEDTYILYPHKDSISVNQLKSPVKNVIAIDCTWYQTGTILKKIQQTKKFKYVRLENYETKFWRYQNHNQKALATAQAVYFLYKEFFQKNNKQQEYKGQLDGLLFLYVLNYVIIQQYHDVKNKEKQQVNEKQQKKQKQEDLDNQV